jgi:hypothetical protein
MKLSSIIIAATLLGAALWSTRAYWLTEIAHPNATNIDHERMAVVASASNNQKSSLPVNPNPSELIPPQAETTTEARFAQLDTVSLAELKPEIENFWRQCTKQQQCEQWLAELATTVSAERYQLIAEYPAKLQQLETLMGSNLITQETTLADKVALVQAQRQQVWGDKADALFAQENAFYQNRQQLATLVEESEYLTQEEQLEALEQLQSAQDSEITPEDKYEQALSLLGNGLASDELNQMKTMLANRYLDTETTQSVMARAVQVDTQQQQVLSYQQGLEQLEDSLATERNSTLAYMTETEWQRYQQQQIFAYRQVFFERKN